MEVDGQINPLVENQIKSFKQLQQLQMACGRKGIKGKLYYLIAQLLPFGIKVYGKYNQLEILPVPGVYEYVEPSLYGL